VESNRTVAIPLNVTEESKSAFHHTILQYAYCQQETVEHCWPDNPRQPSDLETSKQDAENALYSRLRDETEEKLNANLVLKQPRDSKLIRNENEWYLHLTVQTTHEVKQSTKTCLA
jgi:hypothetical protein